MKGFLSSTRITTKDQAGIVLKSGSQTIKLVGAVVGAIVGNEVVYTIGAGAAIVGDPRMMPTFDNAGNLLTAGEKLKYYPKSGSTYKNQVMYLDNSNLVFSVNVANTIENSFILAGPSTFSFNVDRILNIFALGKDHSLGGSATVGQSMICGGSNTINNAWGSFIGGQSNQINNSLYSCIVGSLNNIVGNNHIVGGSGHIITSGSNVVNGTSNTVSNLYNIVSGDTNNVSGQKNIVSGQSNIVSSDNNTVNGLSNNISTPQNLVYGDNNSISGGGGNFIGGTSCVMNTTEAICGGNSCNQTAAYSIMFGLNLLSCNQASAVFGKNNIGGADKIFAVGIGTGTSNRDDVIFCTETHGVTHTKKIVDIPSSQILGAGFTLATSTKANHTFIKISAGANITSSLVNAIENGSFNGQRLCLLNTSLNTITFKQNANIKLPGGVDLTLTQNSIVEFIWAGTEWITTNSSTN